MKKPRSGPRRVPKTKIATVNTSHVFQLFPIVSSFQNIGLNILFPSCLYTISEHYIYTKIVCHIVYCKRLVRDTNFILNPHGWLCGVACGIYFQ